MASKFGYGVQQAVVDASPLMNLLALNYTREKSLSDRNRMITGDASRYLHKFNAQERFLDLFDNMGAILTTSHIIGEIQGLSQALRFHNDNDRKEFWSQSIEYLEHRGLDERLVSLLELSKDVNRRTWIGIIGVPDSGIIHLAKQEDARLLTDDRRTLYKRAAELSVDCYLVQNLVEP